MKHAPKITFLFITTAAIVSLASLNTPVAEETDSLEFSAAAEDVLVQKIPGDNSHLLMMAFYSKENYARPYITINENGNKLVFRDDGKEDDKTAGDGYYTAKVVADVTAFREQAITSDLYTRKSSFAGARFINRALVQDPDIAEAFDAGKLDNNDPVSIAGISTADDTITRNVKDHSLFITSLKVVEDSTRTYNPCAEKGNPNGVWTFQYLMRQLATQSPERPATDKEVSDFTINFFDHWSFNQYINGDTVPARPLLRPTIIEPWLEKSAAEGFPKNQLDMRFAPFKLLAIVNRFDKRNTALNKPAGEVRFLFTLLRGDCAGSKDYTLAIEYAVNIPDNCDSLHAWAQQWYNLKDVEVGSKKYNRQLQALTDRIVHSGSNPAMPNQNSFSSLRTNDQALTSNQLPIFGEFREFALDSITHMLKERETENSAADRYNVKSDNADVRFFAQFVNENQRAILNGKLIIPLTYKGVSFRGAKTRVIGGISVGEPPGPFHWDGTEPRSSSPSYIKNNEARHLVSLNACSGCHTGETQTRFWQVDPVFYGTETILSGFLAGKAGTLGVDFDNSPDNDSMVVKDPALRPVNNPAMYVYNDLLRRSLELQDFINAGCGSVFNIRNQLMFKPSYMVH